MKAEPKGQSISKGRQTPPPPQVISTCKWGHSPSRLHFLPQLSWPWGASTRRPLWSSEASCSEGLCFKCGGRHWSGINRGGGAAAGQVSLERRRRPEVSYHKRSVWAPIVPQGRWYGTCPLTGKLNAIYSNMDLAYLTLVRSGVENVKPFEYDTRSI